MAVAASRRLRARRPEIEAWEAPLRWVLPPERGPFLLAGVVAVLLAFAVDQALMHSRYHGQRLLIEDVRHFPTFHWVYGPAELPRHYHYSDRESPEGLGDRRL